MKFEKISDIQISKWRSILQHVRVAKLGQAGPRILFWKKTSRRHRYFQVVFILCWKWIVHPRSPPNVILTSLMWEKNDINVQKRIDQLVWLKREH